MAHRVHSGRWDLKQSWDLNEAAQEDCTDKGKEISAFKWGDLVIWLKA